MELKLKDYQEEGISQMIEWERCINMDDMGLGKSVQSIISIDRVKGYPLLIICPAGLKRNWEREYNMWTGETAMILNDSIKNTFHLLYNAGICKAFIVNYESLSKFFVLSKPKRKDIRLADIEFNSYKDFFKSIIIDESQKVINPETMQSKLTAGISIGKRWIFELSGTPVLNKPTDLAAQLCIISKINEFGGYSNFMEKYKNPSKIDLELLSEKLKKVCAIRREKKDVLSLPPKTRQIVYVDLDNREEYDFALKNLAGYLKEYKGKTDKEVAMSMRGEVMVKIATLRELSAKGKSTAVFEAIQTMIEKNEKVVLFGNSREVLLPFKKIKGSVSITGGENGDQKQNSVDKFQNDKNTMLAVCSLKASSIGITLTAGRINMYIEQPWHPAIQNQSEDRTYRLGQLQEVHCLYYLGINTIDQYIYDIIEKKREILVLLKI